MILYIPWTQPTTNTRYPVPTHCWVETGAGVTRPPSLLLSALGSNPGSLGC
ncbi:hypothetical protein E2C01_097085 [Portunus trituberculatus]|uniref:Uncharacterized protein n=1 Tax=Portunus trituberculatus TaxID=210409 RepID=A0A5B7JXD6_PORTR|nr:hypothetical protein [Portunus trituberculatus]